MNLIREYAQYNMLIDLLKQDIQSIQESRITAKSAQVKLGKSLGSVFNHRLKEIEAELRKQGMWVRYEDGGDSVYVIVKGRERHEFKRAELDNIDEVVQMIEGIKLPDIPYKVELDVRDPYAKE